MSCGCSSVCRILVKADGSTKQTVIRVLIKLVQYTWPSNMMSMTQRQETLIRKSLATEYTWRSRSWRWHSAADLTPENNTQRLGEQVHNSNGVTQRCSQIYVSPTLKYKFTERHEKLYNSHDLRREACCLSIATPRMSRLGLALMGTPYKTKSQWASFTVLDLLATKALVLLRFSIMHQWYQNSWIRASPC